MRKAIIAAVFLAFSAADRGAAEPLKAAVFDLQLVDTSLEGEMSGAAAERQRLDMLSARLRDALAASERYEVVDTAPVADAAARQNLQACGGCDVRLAAEIGADVSVTGFVQKVSNLILSINILIRDVKTGKLLEGHSADIRSNTDESWTRGLDWLLEHRLLPTEPPK